MSETGSYDPVSLKPELHVVHVRAPLAQIGVYVGRKPNTNQHFGNPFTHMRLKTLASVRVKTRTEAIANFRKWIKKEDFLDVEPERREWILQNLGQLRGRHLVCHCAPLPCHGEVLRELANA